MAGNPLLAATCPAGSNPSSVQRWTPWEGCLAATGDFSGRRGYSDVELKITYQRLTTSFVGYAFWDGGVGTSSDKGVFLFRTAFPTTGTWTWTASCVSGPCQAMHGQSGQVNVTSYSGSNPLRQHGFLVQTVLTYGYPSKSIWSVPKYYDNTPFFWLGDSAWAAPMKLLPDDPEPDPDWGDYLTNRAGKGYTIVHLGSAPYWAGTTDTGGNLPFCQSTSPPGACVAPGPTVVLPNSQVRPNPPFWQGFEARVKAANDKKLVVFLAGVLEPVGGDTDATRYPEQAEAVIFARWIAARLSGYHVVFSPGFDSPPVTVDATNLVSRLKAVGAEIKRIAPRHLVTNHWSSAAWLTETMACGSAFAQVGMNQLNAESWMGFHMFQSGSICPEGPSRLDRLTQRARTLAQDFATLANPKKPSLNGEATYDTGQAPDSGGGRNRYRARQTAWLSALTGSFGYTLGVGGVWDWGLCGTALPNPCEEQYPSGYRTPRSAWTQMIADDIKFFRQTRQNELDASAIFAEQWRLDPVNQSAGETAKQVFARDADNVMVYIPEGNTVVIDVTDLTGNPANYRWINPVNGNGIVPAGFSCNPAAVTCSYTNPNRGLSTGFKDAVLIVVASPLGGFASFSSDGAAAGGQRELRVWIGSPEGKEWGVQADLLRSDDEVERSLPVRLDSSSTSRNATAVALSARGYLAAWADVDSGAGRTRLLARRVGDDGQPEGPIFEVTSGRDAEFARPALAAGVGGRALVAWEELDLASGRRSIRTAVIEADDAVNLDTIPTREIDGTVPSRVKIASNGDGAVLVAWEENGMRGHPGRVMASWLPPGDRKEVLAQQIGESQGTLLSLAWAGSDETGALWVEWEDQLSGRSLGRFRSAFGPEGRFLGVTEIVPADQHPPAEPSSELP
ncbi:MAG: DUF4038 domain-containing protein [Holophagales bacterium]|nr:DUF4038 domain-containing protein [Holophagales bacterium]